MKRIPILAVFAAVFMFSGTPADAGVCEDYTHHHEQANGIPAHLLTAIAWAESGYDDPISGKVRAWPWTVTSLEGDIKYATKDEAVAAVRDLQARGVTNIDVGCMQVNLHHHPQAFDSLERAFDPAANVAYAAQFLADNYRRTGDWRMAVAHYHSTNPEHYAAYQEKVDGFWRVAIAEARDRYWDDDTDWTRYASYSYGSEPRWPDPHWTPARAEPSRRWYGRWAGWNRFERPYWTRRPGASGPIAWYGDDRPADATDVSAPAAGGPWVPVGTGRFN